MAAQMKPKSEMEAIALEFGINPKVMEESPDMIGKAILLGYAVARRAMLTAIREGKAEDLLQVWEEYAAKYDPMEVVADGSC